MFDQSTLSLRSTCPNHLLNHPTNWFWFKKFSESSAIFVLFFHSKPMYSIHWNKQAYITYNKDKIELWAFWFKAMANSLLTRNHLLWQNQCWLEHLYQQTCLINMIELSIDIRPVLTTERNAIFHQARQVHNDHTALLPDHLATNSTLVQIIINYYHDFKW